MDTHSHEEAESFGSGETVRLDEGSPEFFEWLMESNTPPPGLGATNRDWLPVEG